MLNSNCSQQWITCSKQEDARELVEKCSSQTEKHQTKETNVVEKKSQSAFRDTGCAEEENLSLFTDKNIQALKKNEYLEE